HRVVGLGEPPPHGVFHAAYQPRTALRIRRHPSSLLHLFLPGHPAAGTKVCVWVSPIHHHWFHHHQQRHSHASMKTGAHLLCVPASSAAFISNCASIKFPRCHLGSCKSCLWAAWASSA